MAKKTNNPYTKHLERMYGDSLESTYIKASCWTSDKSRVEQLLAAIGKIVPAYNEFDAIKFANLIMKNFDKIGSVTFGRECSPICFLEIKRMVSETEVQKLAASIKKNLMPDTICIIKEEISAIMPIAISCEFSYRIRFWFD